MFLWHINNSICVAIFVRNESFVVQLASFRLFCCFYFWANINQAPRKRNDANSLHTHIVTSRLLNLCLESINKYILSSIVLYLFYPKIEPSKLHIKYNFIAYTIINATTENEIKGTRENDHPYQYSNKIEIKKI